MLSLLLSGAPVASAMYKCVDADGNVTYSQTACEEPSGAAFRAAAARPTPHVDADAGMDGGGSDDVLCDRVRDFALELAWAMRQGVGIDRAVSILSGRADPSSFADGYGRRAGRGSRSILGDDVLEIINQVFAFAGRGTSDPAGIAEAAARRCLQGRFEFDRGAPGGTDGLRRAAGSGILLNPQGMVLTADRLIADCGRLRVYRGGAWHEASLLHRDSAVGLAVLLADDLHGRPAVFAVADKPSDQMLFAMTLPLRGVLSGEVGLADADVDMSSAAAPAAPVSSDAAANAAAATEIDAARPLPLALEPGPAQLGAPLLNSAGLLSGLALPPADDGGPPRLMPAGALLRFLTSADIAHYSAAGLGKLTRQELRRRAAGFTVHVECLP
ncbi:MAG: DUF4124 domain-containing protein [Thiohalocapsa sp.]|uniref:DUF4124 domain-containing protein n=1 Tax=Thiohalocapsa sp. TaxID=2497641 RepID=UPI0025D6A48D|nr:DUF4124 domain-containing protein [Thiohalocapsa sp.]MCG6941606.1 DUF4124 domain-containing protein [Thiohalocapsa sp.]